MPYLSNDISCLSFKEVSPECKSSDAALINIQIECEMSWGGVVWRGIGSAEGGSFYLIYDWYISLGMLCRWPCCLNLGVLF